MVSHEWLVTLLEHNKTQNRQEECPYPPKSPYPPPPPPPPNKTKKQQCQRQQQQPKEPLHSRASRVTSLQELLQYWKIHLTEIHAAENPCTYTYRLPAKAMPGLIITVSHKGLPAVQHFRTCTLGPKRFRATRWSKITTEFVSFLQRVYISTGR